MILGDYAHKITAIEDESCTRVGGQLHPEQRVLAVLPHPVVGSRIEAGYVVSNSTMPAGCLVLLGTGAIARMDIDAAKHCKLAASLAGTVPECCYSTPQPMAATANTPLKNPSTNTSCTSGAPGPANPAKAIAPSAAAEPTHPNAVHMRNDPRRKPLAIAPTVSMPRNTPPFCMPAIEVDCPGVN